MVSLMSLWMPIVVSTVALFVMSFLVWAVLPHHRSDFKGMPDEEATRRVLDQQDLNRGVYHVPHVTSQAEMRDPEVVRKFEEGPRAFVTVLPTGMPGMGPQMVQQILFFLLTLVAVAYVAGRTIGPGADDVLVFRMVATTAWLAYGAAAVPEAVWFGKPWSHVFKHLADALVYGCIAGAVFAWLWPA